MVDSNRYVITNIMMNIIDVGYSYIYIETITRVVDMDINKLIEQAKNTSTKRVGKDKYICLYWNREKEPQNYATVKEFMKKHDLTPAELKLFLVQIIKSKNN